MGCSTPPIQMSSMYYKDMYLFIFVLLFYISFFRTIKSEKVRPIFSGW